MVLRIVFTREDLQRLRISQEPDPLWELVQSLHHIQEGKPADPYQDWHRQARRRIAGHDRARALLGRLTTLVARQGNFPDFLTPVPSPPEIESGCELVASTARELLVPDLSAVFAERPAPQWVRGLAAGDRDDLADVAMALRGAFDLLIRPHWPDIRSRVAEERAGRLRTLSSGGIQALFLSLPGVLGWDGEVLRVRYPTRQTLWLEGRGITLIPSYFCWAKPISMINPDLPPVLVYPAEQARLTTAAAGHKYYLTTLLGQNRADCLSTLTMPHTTSALAARVGISVGSASKQATTLREAGLITSERTGNAVIHRLSPLGAALLSGKLHTV